MTILSTDIRLLESERMTDNTDGGGRRTSRVIPDGVAGNVFPKVSRVDSVYGRANLDGDHPAAKFAAAVFDECAHLVGNILNPHELLRGGGAAHLAADRVHIADLRQRLLLKLVNQNGLGVIELAPVQSHATLRAGNHIALDAVPRGVAQVKVAAG